MARIKIYDDWGNLAHTLEIVSADPKDLKRNIESALVVEEDIHQCDGGCGKYDLEQNMTWDENAGYRCKSCHAAHNPTGESNG